MEFLISFLIYKNQDLLIRMVSDFLTIQNDFYLLISLELLYFYIIN